MTTIADIRAKYPQYKDIPDQQLLDGLYQKSYAGKMSKEDFYKSVGFSVKPPQGLYQQEGKGGLADYLPKPVTNAMQGFADVTDSAMDAATRGFGPKITGTQQDVADARARIGGWHYPGDIIASIAASPYKVTSAAGGALAGGLEGMVSEYGHQKNWVPNLQEAGDIGLAGVRGSGLGYLGSKAGEIIGDISSKFRGPKPPYSTPDELATAAQQADRRTSVGRDTAARNTRMQQAELAQAEGPEGFKKLLAGMDRPLTPAERLFNEDPRIQWPHQEKVQATKLAYPPVPDKGGNILQKALRVAGSAAEGGGGIGRWFTGPLNAAAPILKGLGAIKDPSSENWKALQSIILDSTGRLKTDQATVNLLRDFLAKTTIQGGERTPLPRIPQ